MKSGKCLSFFSWLLGDSDLLSVCLCYLIVCLVSVYRIGIHFISFSPIYPSVCVYNLLFLFPVCVSYSLPACLKVFLYVCLARSLTPLLICLSISILTRLAAQFISLCHFLIYFICLSAWMYSLVVQYTIPPLPIRLCGAGRTCLFLTWNPYHLFFSHSPLWLSFCLTSVFVIGLTSTLPVSLLPPPPPSFHLSFCIWLS